MVETYGDWSARWFMANRKEKLDFDIWSKENPPPTEEEQCIATKKMMDYRWTNG